MAAEKVQLPWHEIDTLLLDMDGTLLDLAFDNFFWLELVPLEYARQNRIPVDVATAELKERYGAVAGTLPWYCVDHWTSELGLDIRHLKRAHRNKIRFLPGAAEFLETAVAFNKRLVLVTNAHPATLAIKTEVTGIDRWFGERISSHELDAAKEDQRFWSGLIERTGIDVDRALLIEDSLTVLDSAQRFGIRHLLAVRWPDSTQPPRTVADFAAVDRVGDIL
jgi:HAD superfamily hydrolase (TIGR01509 family)